MYNTADYGFPMRAPLFISKFDAIARHIVIAVILIFSFRVFLRTPVEAQYLKIEVFYLFFLFVFGLIYLLDKISYKISYIYFYALIIMTIPVYSSITSHITFNQPIVYGIITERKWILIINGVLIYHLLKTKKISTVQIERTAVLLSWITMFLYFLLAAVYFNKPPEASRDFINYYSRGGVRLKLVPDFLVLGVLYYLIKVIRKFTYRHFIFFIFFYGCLFFVYKGRSLSISILIVITILFFIRLFKGIHVLSKLHFIGVSVFLLLLTFLFYGDVSNHFQIYRNAIVGITGRVTGEHSVDSRIREALMVIDYFSESKYRFLFGSGSLSGQWEGGFHNVFGRFYPSEIGILGQIFLYGLFGFILVNTQYLIGFFLIRQISYSKDDIFLSTCISYFFYYAIRSIANAGTVISPANSMLMLFIIQYYLGTERQRIIQLK